LDLPDDQNQLIRRVAAANPRTIIVLENGDPVLMPWLGDVRAAIEAWYPGQRGGQAIANILFGKIDPLGKLPITFPESESQLPRLRIQGPPPGGGYFDVEYNEGLNVGYKWYDANHIAPLFPFGYGLSYTRFSFSNLQIAPHLSGGFPEVRVSCELRNIGARAGAEVVEVYLGLPRGVGEPPKRLVGWTKVDLAPGQARRVSIRIAQRAASHPLSYWNLSQHRWRLASGGYTVYVGDSSRQTALSGTFSVP
jgi:beta-glucosidase